MHADLQHNTCTYVCVLQDTLCFRQKKKNNTSAKAMSFLTETNGGYMTIIIRSAAHELYKKAQSC